MSEKIIVGIDPGLSGAIAMLSWDGEVVLTAEMPIWQDGTKKAVKISGLFDILDPVEIHMMAIEKVHSMPKQGVVSAFTFGYGCGILETAAVAREIPYTHVTPQKWQKHMFEGIDKELGKKRSAIVCAKRWPNLGKVSEGVADALCIAEWLRKTERSEVET
jgi:Holliday junction resolvasome RuvABC endonuclease subunit